MRLSNERQERFAQLIAVSVPLAVAYLEAGFEGGDYAAKNASKLKNKPKVKARIAELRSSDQDMVTERRAMLDEFYVACLKIDRQKLVNRLIDGEELSPLESMLIEGRQGTKYGIKYLMPGKLEAAAQLARLHGLDKPDKSELTGKDGAPLVPEYTDEMRAQVLADHLARVGMVVVKKDQVPA